MSETVLPRRRGRPKKADHQDAKIMERRRQVREAQYRYRQRKIISLEHSKQCIVDVAQSFNDLRDTFDSHIERLAEAGLSEMQQRVLQDSSTIVQRELARALARIRAVTTQDEDHEVFSPSNASSTGDSKSRYSSSLSAEHVEDWMDRTTLSSHSARTSARSSVIESLPDRVTYTSEPMIFDAGIIDMISTPEPVIDPLLGSFLRMTAYGETSFARRVHRTMSIGAHLLLLQRDRYPYAFKHVFRLPLMYRSISEISARQEKLMHMGLWEDYELPGLPSIWIGGAGVHYPRIDAFGYKHERSPSVEWIPRPLTKFNHASAITLDSLDIDQHGFEGTWMDPYDIQGYLAGLDINIDAQSRYIQYRLPTQSCEEHFQSTDMVDGALHLTALLSAQLGAKTPRRLPLTEDNVLSAIDDRARHWVSADADDIVLGESQETSDKSDQRTPSYLNAKLIAHGLCTFALDVEQFILGK